MKLDKIKFARLISFIQTCTLRPFEGNEIAFIDNLIDINVEPVSTGYVEVEKVDELLRCMQERLKGGLVPAIKAYRALTNAGMKEAKEAVEKYSL